MKVQIMTDTWYGNGTKLAECLGDQFSKESDEIKIADVKEMSPEEIIDDLPDVLILGGAIRMFRGDPKSKKWLKKLDKLLKNAGKSIQYGTGFLTHGLSSDKVQGFVKRYLKKIQKCSNIESKYPELLTAQVETQKGPIFPEEMEKAKTYVKDFIQWMNQ